ncbi:FAX1 [Auxenochlorella protothecoides x Auxenochlorella symbiontica]
MSVTPTTLARATSSSKSCLAGRAPTTSSGPLRVLSTCGVHSPTHRLKHATNAARKARMGPGPPKARQTVVCGAGGLTPTRHAVLHDFCMVLPAGGLLLAAGVAGLLAGSGRGAAVVAWGGVAELLLAAMSLKAWKKGRRSVGAAITSLQTGIAAFLSLRLYRVFLASAKPAARIVHGVLLAIAGSLLVFLVYNLLAGGNPPKRAQPGEEP